MRKKETIIKNQNGIASMVIVILIMMLLSLIVLSMTKNANREQRQALDRQLNSQAFYAAESGINDAKDYYTKNVNNPIAADRAPESKGSCAAISGAAAGDQFPDHSSQVGDSVNHYSCVLYDATPDSLALSDVGTNSSVLMPIEDDTGASIKSLTFTWKNKVPNNPDGLPNNLDYNFSNCSNIFVSGFPQNVNDDNCDAGVLRIELIDPTSATRSDLIGSDFVAFALPSSNSGSNPANPSYNDAIGASGQGVVWRGGCTSGAAGECTLTVNNISNPTIHKKLLLHLKSIYNDNEVHITGVTTSGDTISFQNGQMMIDSTGRASDILKRIQVRVPLNAYADAVFPEFSLQTSDNICKLLQILPPVSGQDSTSGCAP